MQPKMKIIKINIDLNLFLIVKYKEWPIIVQKYAHIFLSFKAFIKVNHDTNRHTYEFPSILHYCFFLFTG